ncbi:hypothetical protein PR002_g21687 [Phytophthora rubi]|uniref:Uncharacterized protein n=1 Tax=Phytophthora rubi TaxID=129364 RepID=A0A6A3J4B5_9STRA|nr:hypothetical protein PR002_g21687 [Phytophthora rubi]
MGFPLPTPLSAVSMMKSEMGWSWSGNGMSIRHATPLRAFHWFQRSNARA